MRRARTRSELGLHGGFQCPWRLRMDVLVKVVLILVTHGRMMDSTEERGPASQQEDSKSDDCEADHVRGSASLSAST